MRLRSSDIAAVRAISWDVDGTLYSTRKVASRLWFAILPACLRGTPREAWAALAEMRRFRQRMELLRSTGLSLAVDETSIERRIRFESRWLCPAIAAAGARRGVADTLRSFGTRFETQVALSDFECGHKLSSLGLADAFHATYAGERLGHLKPSPQPFLRVLRDLELPPHALLHIGDRADTDGAGAEAAGCGVLLLGRDFRTFAQLRVILAAGAHPETIPPASRQGSQSANGLRSSGRTSLCRADQSSWADSHRRG